MSGAGDRKIVFALLGIGILCLIGLGGSLYHGKAAELKKLERTLAQKEAELEEMQEKVNRLPELEQQYQDLRERLSVLEPSLPDADYIPTFLRQIENLAAGTRNDILLIRPKPAIRRSAADSAVQINDETGKITRNNQGGAQTQAPPAMPYDFVPIELRLQGTYWTVIDFLAELQEFPKMIAVNDISFSPTQGMMNGGSSPNLMASMELTAVVTKGGSDGRSA
jgi:Tfp pilus assembly protein PilO